MRQTRETEIFIWSSPMAETSLKIGTYDTISWTTDPNNASSYVAIYLYTDQKPALAITTSYLKHRQNTFGMSQPARWVLVRAPNIALKSAITPTRPNTISVAILVYIRIITAALP